MKAGVAKQARLIAAINDRLFNFRAQVLAVPCVLAHLVHVVRIWSMLFGAAVSVVRIWSMLFGAAVSVDNPRGVSSRFVASVWALFAVVFTASYTANLAAFMITKQDYDRITGVNDPLVKERSQVE